MVASKSTVKNVLSHYLAWCRSALSTGKTSLITLYHTYCLFWNKEWAKLWWSVSSPRHANICTVSDWVKDYSPVITYYTVFSVGHQHCTSVSSDSLMTWLNSLCKDLESHLFSFHFTSIACLLQWIKWLLGKLRRRCTLWLLYIILLISFIPIYFHLWLYLSIS